MFSTEGDTVQRQYFINNVRGERVAAVSPIIPPQSGIVVHDNVSRYRYAVQIAEGVDVAFMLEIGRAHV